MDAFNYCDHFLHTIASAHDIARPLQVELHPGVHCDLYRCPHCYGHGQRPLKGDAVTVEDLSRVFDDLAEYDPTFIVSGITTEPLTHPQAAEILRALRARNLRVGLYTKGNRFDKTCAEALLEGDSEAFITFSIDAIDAESYLTLHDIPKDYLDRTNIRGAQYYEQVLNNIHALRCARDRAQSRLQIRIAILLFEETATRSHVEQALERYGNLADLIRFAFPQYRNDGCAPGKLPAKTGEILAELAAGFATQRKVRVLVDTAQPKRDPNFQRCHVQRYQIVIDKHGNLFPCPQVAVANFSHLSFGNIARQRVRVLLASPERRRLFGLHVDRDMKCRICDRKDEALNVMLDRLHLAYGTLE